MPPDSALAGRALVPTSTPGIYRRGRRYVVRIRVHGRQVQRSARTLAEARTVRARLHLDPPAAAVDSRTTLRSYAEAWLASYAGRTAAGIRSESVAGYRAALETHVLPTLGDRRVAEITAQDVKRLAAALTAKPLKPASVRRVLVPLRALLADAAEEGVIRANPMAGVRLPVGPPRPPEERARSLTERQVADLIAAVEEPTDRLLVRVLAACGLRSGEALALRWRDLDPRRVNVRRALARSGRIGPPKSRAGTRAVPLPGSLARDLLAHREESAYSDDDDLVFPNRDGRPRDLKNFANRVFGSAARRAGLPDATPHVLRHSFASRMIREGANIKQLQALIGHATVAMTLDTYTHLFDDDLPPALAEVRADEPEHSGPSGGQQRVNTTPREPPRSPEKGPSRTSRLSR